jgi:hypothetical protein
MIYILLFFLSVVHIVAALVLVLLFCRPAPFPTLVSCFFFLLAHALCLLFENGAWQVWIKNSVIVWNMIYILLFFLSVVHMVAVLVLAGAAFLSPRLVAKTCKLFFFFFTCACFVFVVWEWSVASKNKNSVIVWIMIYILLFFLSVVHMVAVLMLVLAALPCPCPDGPDW